MPSSVPPSNSTGAETDLVSLLDRGLPEPALLVDPAGRILWTNARLRQAWRLGDVDRVGRDLRTLECAGGSVLPDGALAEMVAAVARGESFDLEIAGGVENPGGLHLVRGEPVHNAEGRLQAIYVRFTEVVGQPEVERRLTVETHLRLALGAGRIGVWRYRLSSGEVEWDDNMKEIFGIDHTPTRAEFRAMVVPEDLAPLRAAWETACAGRASYLGEHRVRRPDGRIIHVRSRGTLQTGVEGRPEWMVGITLDRTAEVRATEVLAESESRWRTLADSAPALMWMSGPDGVCTFFSRGWREFTGMTDGELTGDGWTRCIHPEDRPRAVMTCHSSSAAGRAFEMEYRMRRADGAYRWMLDRGAPRRSGEGERVGFVGCLIDITQRREAEAMLRVQAAALRAASTGIVITRRDGVIEWVNPAFTESTGFSAEEAIGRTPGELVKSGRHHPDFYRALWETIASGRVWEGEIVNRRKDGQHRLERMSITPVPDDTGTITHFIAIKRDITDERAAQERVLHSQRLEAIGTLASGVAHDLNNILTPITMMSGLLREAVGDLEAREFVDMLEREALRGATLVKQLLAFSRAQELGSLWLQPRSLLRDIVALARGTFPRNIVVTHEAEPGLWSIQADPTQIHQILLNLCVNARDAMPEGGELRIREENRQLAANEVDGRGEGIAPGPYIVISIRDSGHGIPEAIRHRIFDAFFTTKPPGTGSGLGLATVASLARRHRGFVTFETTPGQGTEFHVFLPARVADDVERNGAAEPKVTSDPPRNRGRVALVVDDEEAVRHVVARALTRDGFRVLTAADGQEALECLRMDGKPVDLVITDLMMPSVGGRELIARVRASGLNVPILAITGIDLTESGPPVAEERVSLLTKPFGAAEFLTAAQRAIDERP